MLRLKYIEATPDSPGPNHETQDTLVDAGGQGLQTFARDQDSYAPPTDALSASVRTWLSQRPDPRKPVVVMVHGFLYDPTNAPDTSPDSPFDSVYGEPPRVNYHLSWLPLVGEYTDAGVKLGENAIAFCYKSVGHGNEAANVGWGNFYQEGAFDLAPRAARALAPVLSAVADQAATVRVLAHSLGTRTTTQAIRLARARLNPSLDRIVMLDGAEFSVDAAAVYANCRFDVVNIANRTDNILRLLAEQFCAPYRPNGTPSACVIGYDGLGANDRWLDLRLDNDLLVNWFANGLAPDGVRYAIDARAEESSHSAAGLDHWACYTNDGNRALVRDLLANPLMTVAGMRGHAVPDGTGAPMYGRFNGLPIPITPTSVAERQRMRFEVSATGGGGSG